MEEEMRARLRRAFDATSRACQMDAAYVTATGTECDETLREMLAVRRAHTRKCLTKLLEAKNTGEQWQKRCEIAYRMAGDDESMAAHANKQVPARDGGLFGSAPAQRDGGMFGSARQPNVAYSGFASVHGVPPPVSCGTLFGATLT